MLLKNAVIKSTCHVKVAVLVVSFAVAGCRGEGTFFSSILDDGGSFDSSFATNAGMDASNGCVACDIDSGQDDAGASVPWASPFPNMGAPGFRNSTETLCAATEVDGNAIDVWSDERGVFALVTGRINADEGADIDAGSSDCGNGNCNIERLFHHDGNDWQLQRTIIIADPAGTIVSRDVELRGAPLSARFVARFAGDLQNNCAVDLVDGSANRCVLEQSKARSLFVVSEIRAFVIEANFGTLLRFNGTDWFELPQNSHTPSKVWADAEQLFVLGEGNPFNVYRFRDRDVPDEPATDLGGPSSGEGGSIWARSADDIWVGSDAGKIFHFDGQAWQQVATLGGASCHPSDAGVRGIWGSGDNLFFHSARSVMRWNGTTFESLASWGCDQRFDRVSIQDLWGNSENEVFFAIRDQLPTADTCGGSIVVRFDGTQFHRM